MSAPNDEPSHDGDWGWEPLGSEDEEPQNAQGVIVHGKTESGSADGKSTSMNKRNSSEKSLSAKRGSFTAQKSLPGIVSSPSFLELEKAIGATLNLASNDSGDLSENRLQSPTTTFPPSRLSSTNLTQQKVNQQRLRQQQHQGQRYSSQNQYSRSPAAGPFSYSNVPNGYTAMPPPMPQLQHHLSVPAKIELAPFINEGESRAIVLFHSVHVNTADIRNACSKHGVLYYIRPEFHGKGVTLISYFDLRAASSAKASLAEDLGHSAEASAHYSVMLHAANGNSEEFRLVVRNLPSDRGTEAEVEAIFARYGQLRSIQKTFEQKEKSLPSSPSSKEGRSEPQRTSAESEEGSVQAGTVAADGAVASADSTNTSSSNNNNQDCKIAYSIEYYNIQDARLAASELSATSAQLWNGEVTVKFAPLDDRKQQLCRQLLATLSRWRTEMATLVSSSAAAAMSYSFNMNQYQQHHQPYGMNMNINNNMGGGQGMAMGMGMQGTIGMGMGYGGLAPHPHQQQQHQQQLGRFGAGGMGTMSTGMGADGASYYDPTNAFYPQQQQQMFLQHQQQLFPQQQMQMQMQQYMASATAAAATAAAAGTGTGVPTHGATGDSNANSGAGAVMHQLQHQQQQQQMPMSVQAMAGLMYVTTEGGADGAARTSPMQSLMPANLSNPNLFNLGLLAAQAEAQMQQQQQHMLVHQQQQQQLSQDENRGGETAGGSSREVDPLQRPGFQLYQQHQLQPIMAQPAFQSGGNRYGQQQQQSYYQQGASTQRSPQQHGGRGANVPPPHHQQHHQQNGGSPFNGSVPLHHHQQHHLQMQYNNAGGGGPQAVRRGGKAPPGVAQQQQYPYSPYSAAAAISGGAAGANSGRSGEQQQQQQHQQHDTDFALDLKRIGADEETRTTVMVRNIPNKYNQQMLLEEVNVGHEGTYDFFYLPIDFKNRCNVGYCFINFLDPKHIPPFVHAFHGQRWKSFNSEKVCAVTFARIQGKQAMISRFQNSSLLEKDDEYQPLLFYSSGPDRGKPEPFPASNNARRIQQTHPHHQQQQHQASPAAPGAYTSQTSPIQSHSQPQSQSQSQTASPASISRSITPPPPPHSANGTPRSLHQQAHLQQQQRTESSSSPSGGGEGSTGTAAPVEVSAAPKGASTA